ncbi:hypothetical protein AB0B50_32445 [Streptomyces sp. NPDC041068]|uniref:hypothetical protein n=1 Tax=Streptomyces sp. NPDC041068 TaxID=3155130 RepID=UPI0033FC391F
MSTAVYRNAASPRAVGTPQQTLLHMSFSVETSRAQHTHTLIGEAAHSLLTAIGAPPALARRMGDAATVAAHYLLGHSALPRYGLHVTTDPDGVTLSVTDYTDPLSAEAPAWLPVSRTGRLEPAPAATDPFPDRGNLGLDLHRTPDGHLRLAYRSPWSE